MSAPEPAAPPPPAAPTEPAPATPADPPPAPGHRPGLRADEPPYTPGPRPARWLDRATALVIAVTVGLAVAAAAPSLLRAAGVDLPIGAGPLPIGPPIAVPHLPPEILSHPDAHPPRAVVPDYGASPFGDEDPVTGERIRRDPGSPLPPRFTDAPGQRPGLRADEPPFAPGPSPWKTDDPDDGTTPHRDLGDRSLMSPPVVLRGALWLHEQPVETSRVVGVVQAGQKVSLVEGWGEWTIVMFSAGDEQRAGWAKKSEIAVR